MTTQLTNLLSREKSPYLLQHRDNPVAWQPWGEEAFTRARSENKPIFLSVGYSTCHWCHVMAHESFADQEVGDVLNAGFINIKVDREERPDVDEVYMKALQALSGGGGWPMSVWLTPDGKPFFAGTYFPKYRLLQLLRRIQEIWSTEPQQLRNDGERLMRAIAESTETAETGDGAQAADWEDALGTYISHFQFHFDEKLGGFGKAPKFPQTMNLMLMMRQDFKSGLNQAEAMAQLTLGQMVRGGMYDQLSGGFHRYSVDERWLVPHFEKMLYDQALITVTLLEAAQVYQEPELARAARETLDYVLREMTHEDGGFYSGQDADSLNPQNGKHEEGYFATYGYDELKAQLGEDELEVLHRVYGVKPQGDFEGRSILHLQDGFDGRAKEEPRLRAALRKLQDLRARRPAPNLDDKVIASWNGWMIWAMAVGARTLQDDRYLQAARRALSFVRQNLWADNRLQRFWRDGEARSAATAEDYASIIHACFELHQADFDPEWVKFAGDLQTTFDQDFWDQDDGGYFTNDGREALLPVRSKDDYDGVSPGANSMAALNLTRFFLLTGEARYKHQADRIFEKLFPKFKRYPSGLPFLGIAMDLAVSDARVVVVSGDGWAQKFYREQARRFLPHVYWTQAERGWPVAADKSVDRPAIYVCEEGRCLAPAQNADEALRQLIP